MRETARIEAEAAGNGNSSGAKRWGWVLLFLFLASFFPQILSFRLSMNLRPLLELAFDFHVKPFMLLAIGFTPLFFITIRRLRLYRHEWFMLLFYVYFMATVFWAQYRGTGLKLAAGTLIMFYVYLVARAVFFQYGRIPIERALMVTGLLFNAVSLVLYAIGFAGWASEAPKAQSGLCLGLLVNQGIPRLSGLVYNSNYFVLFDSVFFFYFLSNLKKRLHTVGLVLSGVAILLTVSIGGIGAVFIPFVMNLFLERDRSARRKVLLLFSAVVLAFILLYFALLKNTRFFAYRLESLKTGSYRYEMWGYALSLFKERPFFGIGLYGFRHFARKLFGIMNMHNTWLKTLVEGGAAGFILFAWFNLLAAREIFKAYRRDDSARYLFLTYVSVLLVFLSLSALIHEVYFLVFALMSRYLDTDTRTRKGMTRWKRTR